MRHSIDRILVSHAGNLPRPDDLNQLLAAGESKRVALSSVVLRFRQSGAARVRDARTTAARYRRHHPQGQGLGIDSHLPRESLCLFLGREPRLRIFRYELTHGSCE